MATNSAEIIEEHFENIPTGVEVESIEEEAGVAEVEIERPWNPNDIRVSTKQFSLRNILDLIDEKALDLAPDFQRNAVWKPRQKSRLIESILLQIPLPAFYFAEDTDGMMRVVDGMQRLSTVRSFVRAMPQGFRLVDLEYLHDQEGTRFSELPVALQRRIHNTQIVVHVIDPATPSGVKYDIFKRINTGGTPLSAQEIRHCMNKDRSRQFLKRCAHAPEFDRATGGSLRDHIRMDDREVVLRYCAFWMLGVEGYADSGSMDDFLDRATRMIDDASEVPDERLADLSASFGVAMENCYLIFGDHAFRKWPQDVTRLYPINRPLFESWSYVLGGCDRDDLERRKSEIVASARELMTSSREYNDAITAGTGSVAKVRLRFRLAEEAAGAGR